MDANAKDLLKRGERLFSQKQTIDGLNQEIAEQFYAARADFTSTLSGGDEFHGHQVDSYPEMVRRDLGNAFSSMLRPSDRQWFEPRVGDEDLEKDQKVQEYLEYVQQVVARILDDRETSFKRATMEADNDLAAFGNAVLSVTDNRNRNGMVIRNWHLRDCAWAEDENGQIATLHRRAKPTVYQLAKQFGENKLPEKLRKILDKDPYAEVPIAHCVVRTEDYAPYKKTAAGQPFVSVFYTMEGHVLEEIGEPLFPYVVPRWAKISNSPYAYSPAARLALPNARLIQRMMLTFLESAEKAVDPPLVATHEAIRSDVDLTAGGITWIDREYDERLGDALRPLELGKDLSKNFELILKQRELLAEAFYLTKINLPQTREKTAYETARLVEEYIRNALPLFDPLEVEYSGALLEAVTARAFKLGAFGPADSIPPELQGSEISYKFNTPLRDAIERKKIQSFNEVAQLGAVVMQTDPTALKNLNVAEMFRQTVSATGAPIDWLKPVEQVQEEIEAANQQAAAQAQAQQMMGNMQQAGMAGEAVGKAGAALNEAGMGGRLGN